MPSDTFPANPTDPQAPALPARAQGAASFTTMMTIGPQGYMITASWHIGWQTPKVSSGWQASPADAWTALGPLIAPYLNGSAMSAVTPASHDY